MKRPESVGWTKGPVLKPRKVCLRQGVGVAVEEIVRSDRERSVVVLGDTGYVVDFENPQFAVGGGEAPPALILNEGEGVYAVDIQIRYGKSILLGRAEDRNPVLGRHELTSKHPVQSHDAHLVNGHVHLVESDVAVGRTHGQECLLVVAC